MCKEIVVCETVIINSMNEISGGGLSLSLSSLCVCVCVCVWGGVGGGGRIEYFVCAWLPAKILMLSSSVISGLTFMWL
jgi:hypothetical protein